VLVAGFGPFVGVRQNPSGEVLPLLSREVSTVLLPVEYDRATLRLCQRIESEKPDIAILLGVAEGERALRLETVAKNLDDAPVPDNVGIVHVGVEAVPGAAPLYRSTLPLRRLERALRWAGFPVTQSADAGGYVCNHVFFTMRHFIEERGLATRSGLIHVPATREETGWTIRRLADAVNRCVATLDTRPSQT